MTMTSSSSSNTFDDLEKGITSNNSTNSIVVNATEQQASNNERTIDAVSVSDNNDDEIIKPVSSRNTSSSRNSNRRRYYSLSLFLALFVTTAIVTIANGMFISYDKIMISVSLFVSSWMNNHHHLDSTIPSSSSSSSSIDPTTTTTEKEIIKVNKYVPLTNGNDGKIYGYVLQEQPVDNDEGKPSNDNSNGKWMPLMKPNDSRIYGYHWVTSTESSSVSSLDEQTQSSTEENINVNQYVPLTKNNDGRIYGYVLKDAPINNREGIKKSQWEPLKKDSSDNRIYGYVLQESTGDADHLSKLTEKVETNETVENDRYQINHELELKLSSVEYFDDDNMSVETVSHDHQMSEERAEKILALLSTEYIDDDTYWTNEERTYISSTTEQP